MGKIGFVLEGGGLRGAYQCGAIKALYENGIRPNVITGTSIGALNGALISLGKLERLEELYENFEAEDFFVLEPQIVENLELEDDLLKQIPQMGRALVGLLGQGGVDIKPLEGMLEKEAPEEALRKSDIELGLVTLEIPKVKPVEIFVEDIPEGQVHDYLLASAYMPFFKAEERRFVDGGIVDNAPLALLEEKGPFDQIYIIRSHGGLIKKTGWNRENITVITPSRKVGRMFNMDKENIKNNLRMGYYDTLKILQGHQGSYYSFKDLPDLSQLLIDKQVMEELFRGLSTGEGYDYERYYYEVIIPDLARGLGLGVESSYQQILIELLETGGRYLNINPNHVYELEEFLELMRNGLDEKGFSWSIKEKLSIGVAKYTRGWLGDIENYSLALLDILVKRG